MNFLRHNKLTSDLHIKKSDKKLWLFDYSNSYCFSSYYGQKSSSTFGPISNIRFSMSKLNHILQPKKTIRNCEYRNDVLNIEIRFSIFGHYPSTKENNYIILNIEMYSKPIAHFKFFKPNSNLVLKILNPALNTSNLVYIMGLKVKVHINSSN